MRGQSLQQPRRKPVRNQAKKQNVKLDRMKRRLKLTLRSCARNAGKSSSKNPALSASPKAKWQFKTRKKKTQSDHSHTDQVENAPSAPKPSCTRVQNPPKVECGSNSSSTSRDSLSKPSSSPGTAEDELKLSTLRDSLRSRMHGTSSTSDVALLTTTCTTSVYAVLTSSSNTPLTTSTSSRIQSFTVTCHNAIHTKASESSHPPSLVAQQWRHVMETIEQVARGDSSTRTGSPLPTSTVPAVPLVLPSVTSAEKDKVVSEEEDDEEDEKQERVSQKQPTKKKKVVVVVGKKPKKKTKEKVASGRSKRKRVASLNASAKVHCLLENEARHDYRTISRSSHSDSGESSEGSNDSESGESSSPDERVTRGRSSSRTNTRPRNAKHADDRKKKTSKDKVVAAKESPQRVIRTRAVLRKQKMERLEKKKQSQLAALAGKDLVLPKRMASLNASAIMAASQWAEKCVTPPTKKSPVSGASSKTSEGTRGRDDPNPESVLVSGSAEELTPNPDLSEEGREKTGLVKSDHSVTISKVVIDTCSTSPDGTKMLKKSFTSHAIQKGSNTKERREMVTSSITQGPTYNPLGALRNMRLPDQWVAMDSPRPGSPRLDVCTVKTETTERLSEPSVRVENKSPRTNWCSSSSPAARADTAERETSSSQASSHLTRPSLGFPKQETNRFSPPPPPIPPPTLHVSPYPQPTAARFAPLHYPPSFPSTASGYQDSLYNPYMSPTHYSDVVRYPYPSCLYPGAFPYPPYYCPPPVPPAPPPPSVSVLHSHYIAPLPNAKTVADAAEVASSVLNVAPLYTQVETRTHASTWFPASRLGTALPTAPYWTFGPPAPGCSAGYGGNCSVPCSCPSSSPACPKNGWAGPMSGEGVGPSDNQNTPPPPLANALVSPPLEEASMAANMGAPTPSSEDKESSRDTSVTVSCCKWAIKRKKGSAAVGSEEKTTKSTSKEKHNKKKKLMTQLEEKVKNKKEKVAKKKPELNEKLKAKSETRKAPVKQIKSKDKPNKSTVASANKSKLWIGVKVSKGKETKEPKKQTEKHKFTSPGDKKSPASKVTLSTEEKLDKVNENNAQIKRDENCNATPNSKAPQECPAKPQWSNGWRWEGEPYEAKIYLRNDDVGVVRRCYPAIKHTEGDVIRVRDCVLLRSGPRPKDLPYVAKVAALYENHEDGEMMVSVLWYYRPEHTEQGRLPNDLPDEVFASRHRDFTSVACIEDKCYVLTFNEYCRYRKHVRMIQTGLVAPSCVVPSPCAEGSEELAKHLKRWPSLQIAPDRVLVCRKVYDFRQKRILKNPT